MSLMDALSADHPMLRINWRALEDLLHGRHPTHREVRAGLLSGKLKPRYHNGIGFAQVYLTPDVRLHIWHPEFPSTPQPFGCRHSHRFDFESTVLHGAIIHTTLEPKSTHYGNGFFNRYSVQPAHLGAAEPQVEEFGMDVGIRAVQVFHEGETYKFPKGVYHESAGHGITATLMRKHDQDETHAFILAPAGQPPEHGMARETISQAELLRLILETLDRFNLFAWDHIEKEITNVRPR